MFLCNSWQESECQTIPLSHHFSVTLLQALCEECECCGRSLAELGVAVQEFGEQNPLLCKQLGDAVAKLTEVQRHTTQQVQDRANRLKKVRCKFSSTCHVDPWTYIYILYIILWPISGGSVSFVIVCVNDLFWSWSFSCEQAERQAEEYQGMRAFILGWTEKAEALVTGSIIWSSASQLQEQIRAHQVSLNECHSREWAWRRKKNWVLIHFIFTFPQK